MVLPAQDKSNLRILVVEDADTLREVLCSVLEGEGYTVDSASSAEEGIVKIKEQSYSCILADYKLPNKTGIDLLKETREVSKTIPFLIMTAFGSIEISVEAMKLGANDFICKPFEPTILCSILEDVIEHRRIIDRTLGTRARRQRQIMTESPSMSKILDQARRVARVSTPVLILGESGTGKELLARYIHEHSDRRDKPFVAVNCAALPPDLLESEFFGHEAGAFTGATQSRIGVFEFAADGTIFLDEIGDMPTALQVKLLRALQEHEIRRIGSNKTIPINPRVISATNHDLERALESGAIRDDFYYRIAVVTLTVPPLRDRATDIDLLTRYFIDYFCTSIGKETLKVDEVAQDILKCYRWPGNARELENVMERAVVLATDIIKPEHLGIDIDLHAIQEASTTLPQIAHLAVKRAEIEAISKILLQTNGNKSRAAQILGISYKTLLNKVKEYGLDIARETASLPGS